MSNDLFPETLIVKLVDGKPMTNSVLTAKYFGKKHKNVLRIINSLVERTTLAGRRLNFEPSSYLNEQGKRQPMYLLTELGFQFVVSGFTGPEADEWKWRFFEQFADIKAQLTHLLHREADGLYAVRPRWKPIVRNPQLSRKELITLTGHTSVNSITACRKRIRDAGLL